MGTCSSVLQDLISLILWELLVNSYIILTLITKMLKFAFLDISKGLRQGLLSKDKGNTQIIGYCIGLVVPLTEDPTWGYCVFEGIIVSWKRKKQNVIVLSFTDVKYRPMALAICELVWIK